MRQSYKKSVKKNRTPTAARCRENWPNRQVYNVSKKSTALTAAACSEKYLRKVCFFTAIRHSYKTLVSKKNTALTAER